MRFFKFKKVLFWKTDKEFACTTIITQLVVILLLITIKHTLQMFIL